MVVQTVASVLRSDAFVAAAVKSTCAMFTTSHDADVADAKAQIDRIEV